MGDIYNYEHFTDPNDEYFRKLGIFIFGGALRTFGVVMAPVQRVVSRTTMKRKHPKGGKFVSYLECHKVIALPGAELAGLTWDGNDLWVTDCNSGMLVKLDPISGSPLIQWECNDATTGLGYKDHVLWQVAGNTHLRLINVNTGRSTVNTIANGPGELCGIEWSMDGLWLGYASDAGSKLRLVKDGDVNMCLAEFDLPGVVSGVTLISTETVAWADYEESLVTLVRVSDGATVDRFALEGHPTGITWDGAHLWYCDEPGNRICRVAFPPLSEL